METPIWSLGLKLQGCCPNDGESDGKEDGNIHASWEYKKGLRRNVGAYIVTNIILASL